MGVLSERSEIGGSTEFDRGRHKRAGVFIQSGCIALLLLVDVSCSMWLDV